MKRHFGRAAVALALVAGTIVPGVARAADVPYDVYVDGRPMDASGNSARGRNGVTYVDVVRAVKAFAGVLTFATNGAVRVTLLGRTMLFTPGKTVAILDESTRVGLPGAPFVSDGETYVPLAAFATLAHAKATVDARAHRASLTNGTAGGYPPAPAATTSDDDVAPSATQALAIEPAVSTDAAGLHARATLTNTTAKTYVLAFDGAEPIAFVVSRDGNPVWNSVASHEAGPANTLAIEPRASRSFAADWAGFAKAGPGRYTLRVRLLTAVPLDSAPLSIGVTTPAPSAPL